MLNQTIKILLSITHNDRTSEYSIDRDVFRAMEMVKKQNLDKREQLIEPIYISKQIT